MTIKVSFIILSFNSRKFLSRCFDSIISKCQEEKISYEVIIIDNGSSDDSSSIIKHYQSNYKDNFRVIFLPKNMGTTYPRNLGLKQSVGQYICILDSDTEILQGSMEEVFDILEKRRDVGLIAPQLILDDGDVQNSVKKFPTFLHKIIKIPKAVFKINTPNIDFYTDFPFATERQVESAISACWIFKKNLLHEIGYFDENLFYSPEDLEYCIRVRKGGKSIIYYPFLKVLHHTQQISHNSPFSRVSISHFLGLLYYYKKHGGWFSTKKIYSQFRSI
jgi:GT2 family glycosyltransferase